jgi:hypothetical protein
MMDVLLIRHGTSLMNDHERRQWISQKAYDRLLRHSPKEPLTRKGKGQVRELAKVLRGEPVRILYTSPWRRARSRRRNPGRPLYAVPVVCGVNCASNPRRSSPMCCPVCTSSATARTKPGCRV